jgi:dienelactone hydrolase
MKITSSNRWISSRSLLSGVLSVLFATEILGGAAAQSQGPQREIFPPGRGKGAIVVVVCGLSGKEYYRDFSSKLAELGYYTVLMEGKDLFNPFATLVPSGPENLQTVIADSQSAPQAVPGKVALVGFSLGGLGVLFYGSPLKDQVSAVVAYYPGITLLGSDMTPLAARLQTPVLLLAGEQDRYMDCCLIESMRALATAPKTVPFELVEYPNAGHGFNLNVQPFTYRAQDAADAWARTVAFLNRLHPPGGK